MTRAARADTSDRTNTVLINSKVLKQHSVRDGKEKQTSVKLLERRKSRRDGNGIGESLTKLGRIPLGNRFLHESDASFAVDQVIGRSQLDKLNLTRKQTESMR
jgi:hypothetical protein